MKNTIRVERAKLGISQRFLAKKVNMTAPAISKIENNEVDPKLSTAKRIASYFGLKISELFSL